MGIILSRYRRKKTSDEILEDIQNDIHSLEKDRDLVLQRQNYVVGRFIIYSVILYVLTAALFYFWFFPASLADRIFYMIPLLMFPLLVVILKKFITWYYRREITHNKDKLADLKAQKKKILEDVMNKETYKVAKEILEKYAPEQLKKPEKEPILKPITGISNLQMPTAAETEKHLPALPKQSLQLSRVMAQPGFIPVQATPIAMRGRQGSSQRGFHSEAGSPTSPQRRLIRPIIPRERNFFDRIVESIVGDGPNNRFALICKNCSSHNGMALKEEFEYLAFRCAYCGFPNPSLKVRPRGSQPRSRSSSADRTISYAITEKLDDSCDSSLIGVDTNVLAEQQGSNEPADPEVIPHSETPVVENSEDVEATVSENPADIELDSGNNSSNPSDGIRPRKPLLLSD